ncbi:MAG: oxidoreductase [Flavobacteriaceae bacterium]|nr:oxidoreductase [Flavobacteriaceae bacterium]
MIKQSFFYLLILMLFNYCNKDTVISRVEINSVLIDSEINIRTLEIKNNKVYSATSNGSILYFDIDKSDVISETNYGVENDSIIPNFRSLAVTENDVFAISISNPALLFKNGQLVYKETHSKVFYDSMEFWNNNEGIAVGDFTDNCISIIITRNGGDSWKKLDCSTFRDVKDSEGFFAASDTNISIVEDFTWIASGGINSRVYFSKDKGRSWEIFNTPILQGESTTGIFSIDFYDKNNGYAIGGDYTKPEIDSLNKIITSDGGKTWKSIADNQNPGFRSCVQYFPSSNGKKLLAVGFNGIDFSSDSGLSWKHFSDEGYYTVRFLNDTVAYAAGNGKISQLIFK